MGSLRTQFHYMLMRVRFYWKAYNRLIRGQALEGFIGPANSMVNQAVISLMVGSIPCTRGEGKVEGQLQGVDVEVMFSNGVSGMGHCIGA